MNAPMVLLHPLGSDRTFWSSILDRLEGRELVALDLPGHGSGPELPLGSDVDEMTALVIAELDARGIGRCVVAGISLGGLVAQRLATLNADRVDRLVLIDTVAAYPDGMRRMWDDRSVIARSKGVASLVDATLDVWFTEEFAAARGPEVSRTIEVLRRMSSEAYARTCELLRDVDLSWDVDNLRHPTLVVCGEGDGEPFVASARAFSAAIPGAQMLWLRGKHAAILEHPQAFVEALTAFVDATAAQPLGRGA